MLILFALFFLSVSGSCVSNVTYVDCGYSMPAMEPSDSTAGCSSKCCVSISVDEKSGNCSSDTSFLTFKNSHINWQKQNCQFVCGLCLNVSATILGSNTAPLNRAYLACGVSTDPSKIDGSKACSLECCSNMSTAFPYCSNDNAYNVFDAALTAYQLFNCDDGYTCYPNDKCFDPQGLINSNRGAINRAFATCGMPDVNDFSFENLLPSNFDAWVQNSSNSCSNSCCVALGNAGLYCYNQSESTEYDILYTAFLVWQAGFCNGSQCRANDQCFDPYGLINSNIGAAHRAMKACGAPISLNDAKSILDNQLNFNISLACTQPCCDAMAEAEPFCNSSSAFDALDVALTGYQLLYCSNSGFTCVPNNKCFDELGLVNADRGYLNRAFKTCGIRADAKTYAFDINTEPINTNDSCSETCCLAFENAAPFCNDSTAYQVVKAVLPAWQAKWCTEFQCEPTQCFEPVGIINSRLGAANRVLRYCGAPSEISSLSEITDGSFDVSLACQNRCCEEVDIARQKCSNDSAFDPVLLGLLDIYQAKNCPTKFLCRPDNKCFDPAGVFNPEIGAFNRALFTCGAPLSTKSIDDVSKADMSTLNKSSACDEACCDAIEESRSYCSTQGIESVFHTWSEALVYYQALNCEEAFTCNIDTECYNTLGVINSKLAPLQFAMSECGFTGDLNHFSWDLDTQLDHRKACDPHCCTSLDDAAAPCNSSSLYPLFSQILTTYQQLYCFEFQCNITATASPLFSIGELSFAASVAIVAIVVIVAYILLIVLLCVICRH